MSSFARSVLPCFSLQQQLIHAHPLLGMLLLLHGFGQGRDIAWPAHRDDFDDGQILVDFKDLSGFRLVKAGHRVRVKPAALGFQEKESRRASRVRQMPGIVLPVLCECLFAQQEDERGGFAGPALVFRRQAAVQLVKALPLSDQKPPGLLIKAGRGKAGRLHQGHHGLIIHGLSGHRARGKSGRDDGEFVEQGFYWHVFVSLLLNNDVKRFGADEDSPAPYFTV